MRVPRLAVTVIAIVALTAATILAADPTFIRITDTTLVEGTVPFGINLGGDAYYSGAALRACLQIMFWPQRGVGT